MKAIILSAGMGTRVGDDTLETPKCMLDISGTNILEIQVRQLKSLGISDIFVIGGHYAHKIINPDINLIKNVSYKTTNMFYSLMCAKEFLNDDIVISYGDIIYFTEVLKLLITNTNKDVIVADIKWREYWQERFGHTETDLESFKISEGYISNIGDAVKNSNKIDARYIGLMKFSKKTLDCMIDFYDKNITSEKSSKIKTMYLTDVIQNLINGINLKVPVQEIKRGWCEIDTSDDYDYAKSFYKQHHQLINSNENK